MNKFIHLSVRKLISYLLFGLMTWQIIGFVGYFEFSHFTLKREIKSLIKKGIPNEDLVILTFSPAEIGHLTWLNKNEFELNNNLYDVIRSSKRFDGNITFECISDKQEKALFAQLGQSVSINLGNDDHPTPISNWFKLLKLPILSCESYVEVKVENESIEKAQLMRYAHFFQSIYSEIDSPPPQIS